MGRPMPGAAAALSLLLLLLPSARGLRSGSFKRTSAGQAQGASWPAIRIQSPPKEPEHSDCQVSPSNACGFASLKQRDVNLVYPDPAVSRTRCLTSQKGGAFAFQVIPRDPSKVVIWFEGGGACWNKGNTLGVRTCWRDQIWAYPMMSFFNGSNPENVFRDYTFVFVNACSGDLHSGNVTRDYNDTNGFPIEQRGYYNTRAVLDWVKANLGDKPIDDLLITGESAGAIGVQVWSRNILTELQYKRVAVVADSYAAVFPPNFQGEIFSVLGVCDTGMLRLPELQEKCFKKQIEISDVFEATIRDFPNVPFAMINSKYDRDQQVFYAIAAKDIGQPSISPAEYHQRAVAIFRRYNKYPNIVFYQVTSMQHVFLNGYVQFRHFTPAELVVSHPTFLKIKKVGTRLLAMENYMLSNDGIGSWVSQFPPAKGAELRSHCEIRDPEHMPAMSLEAKYPAEIDSCEDDLASKTFVVP